MNKKVSVVILLLIGAAVVAIYLFQGSEGQKVKRAVNGLGEATSMEEGEALVKKALRLKGVGDYFGDPVLFELDEYGIAGVYTPEEVVSLTIAATAQFNALTVKFYDIDVEFQEENFALVAATVSVTGRMRSGEAFNEAREVDMELIKAGRVWYITRISTIEVLEK